jgi:hypothetical protein
MTCLERAEPPLEDPCARARRPPGSQSGILSDKPAPPPP